MKKILGLLIFALLALSASLLMSCNQKQEKIRVGIIMPMDHMALREITRGFEETLQKKYKKPIQFKVAKAQNDANLQRAIISQMRDENYNIIAPIGTATTQMTISLVKKQNVLGLAAEYTGANRSKLKNCNFGIVDDQINDEQIIAFIHQIYPKLKTLTLVHSATGKIFPEVKIVKNAGEKYGIDVHSVMIQSLSDLYTIAHALPKNTQAIFILKDSLIASGIDTLIQIANQRKIPLITSDDGTVQDGAGFALGVHEYEIGAKGGELAAKVLKGTPICDVPIMKMTHPTVFINAKAIIKQGQNIDNVKKAAQKLNYKIEVFSKSKERKQ